MTLIILTILYIIFIPIIIPLFKFLFIMIKNQMFRVPKNRIKDTPKVTLKEKFKKARRYCFKEEKKYFFLMIGLYILGLLICVFSSFWSWTISVVFFFFPYIINLIVYNLTKKTINDRELVLNKMLQLKQSKMGLANKEEVHIDNEIQVLAWDEDKITPSKLRLFLPVVFDPIISENFILQWNIVFGSNRSYAPDIDDKEFPGWQYSKGVVTLIALDPLPDRADWDVSYLDPSQCAWSFFPLAISNVGGTMMKHPETGKMVHVLGIDLAGKQQKTAKQNGLWCSNEILASPQTLIIGATGSGKSLQIDTKLFIKEHNQ